MTSTQKQPSRITAGQAESGTDVVIVGAGPTGLTLASLLGGQGVRVAVVDPDRGNAVFDRIR